MTYQKFMKKKVTNMIRSETFSEKCTLRLNKFNTMEGHWISSDKELFFKDIFGNEKFHKYFNFRYFKVEYNIETGVGSLAISIDPINPDICVQKIDCIDVYYQQSKIHVSILDIYSYPQSKIIQAKVFSKNLAPIYFDLVKKFELGLPGEIEFDVTVLYNE